MNNNHKVDEFVVIKVDFLRKCMTIIDVCKIEIWKHRGPLKFMTKLSSNFVAMGSQLWLSN